MSNFDPRRISLARHLEGMTQKELSLKSGISQAKLSKLQTGITEFAKEDAIILAHALDYPVSYFESHGETLLLSDLTYRKTSKSSIRELSAVASEYSQLSVAANLLADRLHLSSKTAWFDTLAPRSEGNLNEREIDMLADSARSQLGLPNTGAISNVTRAIERMGVVVAPMRSLNMSTETHLTSEGVTLPAPKRMECIGYYGANEVSGDRLRFTKAHEFGHLLLHRFRRPTSPQQTEREAHLFAAALLFPRKDAENVFSPNMMLRDFLPIKAGWGVSIAALIARAHSMGIIDKNRYQSLFIQLSARGWKKKEPVPVDFERPLLLRQMIEAGFASNSNGNKAIDSIKATSELATPFKFLDYWADGIKYSGEGWGIDEERFLHRPNRPHPVSLTVGH